MQISKVTTEAAMPYGADLGAWTEVCDEDDIVPGTGVAALVEGEQIAVVRSPDGAIFYAISNFDPYSKAFVLSRGIVGDKGGVLKISSPIYKQAFDLATGVCLDEPSVVLPTYPVRIRGSRVEVKASAGDGVLRRGALASTNADAE